MSNMNNNDWCIQGCDELREYFNRNRVPNLCGDNKEYYYYKYDESWFFMAAPKANIITLQEYIDTYEFKLPEKWCVKVKKYSNPSEVAEWRPKTGHGNYWMDSGYIHHNGHHHTEIINGCTEITLEQFRKHVLSNKENKKEMKTDKKQTLTRAHLLELHKKFECGEWKKEIENIVKQHPLASDDDKIEIPQSAIEKLRSSGSVAQKSAAISAGITLETYKGVQIRKGGSMFDISGIILLERREDFEYACEAFWLNDSFNWEIKRDSNKQLVLIPTTK